MFNTSISNNSANTNLNINAINGMIVKNHPKSFIIKCDVDSVRFNNLFDRDNPMFRRYGTYNKYEPVVVLQVLLCGEKYVMCEIVYKKDWEEDMDAE